MGIEIGEVSYCCTLCVLETTLCEEVAGMGMNLASVTLGLCELSCAQDCLQKIVVEAVADDDN